MDPESSQPQSTEVQPRMVLGKDGNVVYTNEGKWVQAVKFRYLGYRDLVRHGINDLKRRFGNQGRPKANIEKLKQRAEGSQAIKFNPDGTISPLNPTE